MRALATDIGFTGLAKIDLILVDRVPAFGTGSSVPLLERDVRGAGVVCLQDRLHQGEKVTNAAG